VNLQPGYIVGITDVQGNGIPSGNGLWLGNGNKTPATSQSNMGIPKFRLITESKPLNRLR